MIHTVHLFHKCSYRFHDSLFETLIMLSKSNGAKFYEKSKNECYFHLLQERGIKIILKRIWFEEGINYCAIEVVINPMRLLSNDYLQLTEMKHYNAIKKEWRRAFNGIKKAFESCRDNRGHQFRLHILDAYKAKRIDFARNIRTIHADSYMELLRRSNIPEGFVLYEQYSTTSKRKMPPSGSFYIYKKGKKKTHAEPTITVNIYNKSRQLENADLPQNSNVSHTLRFEVQCRYGKVYRLKRNNGDENDLISFLEESVSANVLEHYFKKTVGSGDYYSLTKAKEIVENHPFKKSTKFALLETLDLVSQKRGIWKAKNVILDQEQFEIQLKKLHDIGVNPVTIPKAWGIDYLPSLFKNTQKKALKNN